MGRDDSWSAMLLSVVPSYSHADSNLIGPAHSVSPCHGFFPTTRTTYVPVNSTSPRIRLFQSPVVTAQNGRTVLPTTNLLADSESRIQSSYLRFVVTIGLSRWVSKIFTCDRLMEGRTTRTIATAGPHTVASQPITCDAVDFR